MKKKIFLSLITGCCMALFTQSCAENDNDFCRPYEKMLETKLKKSEQKQIDVFEGMYLRQCNMSTRATGTNTNNGNITLVGYKTVSYHGEDSVFVNKLWTRYRKEIDECGFALPLDGKVRVYFQMKDAIVSIDGKIYKADSTGTIYDVKYTPQSKIRLIGSEKSKYSVRTLFSKKYCPEKIYTEDNAMIFNLGERRTCCSKNIKVRERLLVSEGEPGETSVPCVNNHPGYPNCSKAFNITTPRCPFKSDRCMDYNGFGTDCSGSHLYFVGSDCYYALAQFHCWNEIM